MFQTAQWIKRLVIEPDVLPAAHGRRSCRWVGIGVAAIKVIPVIGENNVAVGPKTTFRNKSFVDRDASGVKEFADNSRFYR